MDAAKPRMVGINHVAIEVGDIDAALAFYGEIFQSPCAGGASTMRSSISATSSSR